MYELAVGLSDGDDGDPELSDRLRRSLSEWLTVPVPFMGLNTTALDELGNPGFVEVRWGERMRSSLDAAKQSLAVLKALESPLRAQLCRVLRDTSGRSIRWRIYCHRSAAEHFESCALEAGYSISPDVFIHSLRDYRDAEPFDVLIKVGPLRTRGWGSIPSACANAPRYHELVQVVWTGMSDEAGFGEDPIVTPWVGTIASKENSGGQEGSRAGDIMNTHGRAASLAWSRSIIIHEDSSDTGQLEPFTLPDESSRDELQAFAQMGRVHTPRRALLLHIGNNLGLLYPPHAEVLFLIPGAQGAEAVSKAILSEIDPRGRYLIRADIGDVNLGNHLTDRGWYSTRWKAELKQQFEWHEEGLLRKLRAAGIKLRNLGACVELWIQPASTVIHAPQQRRHFQILVDVLDMETRAPRPSADSRAAGPWWRAAWQEIAASRGLAIQYGMQEQEIIDEELDRIVLTILPAIQELATKGEPFRIAIPPGHSLEGSISFLPIHEVEQGFRVPNSLLKSVVKLSEAEEWRA
jgi:hypothetical protein